MNNILLSLINLAEPSNSNFIVKIFIWLVSITSSVIVAVILFTLILKLITLPFDFFSRASMRKNSLKMEEMRPELERLQKQYANDKNLYNQKMMALYKKNGYSMWGACLPTIITLVIFIVAINGFSSYSYYQNQKYFYDMAGAYNYAIFDEFIGNDFTDNKVVYNSNTIIYITEDNKISVDLATILNDEQAIEQALGLTITDNGTTCEINAKGGISLVFPYNQNKVITYNEITIKGEQTTLETLSNTCSEASAKNYKEADKKFLWVKNIWVSDSPFKHPVESSVESFKKAFKIDDGNLNSESYNALIKDLEEETTSPNGYFVLIILTAGSSLLLQLITKKSQKAQDELQTVDGQGAQTQKMMTYMMPIMMAIFSFMYTAAFSVYIVLSSAISIVNTLVINAIVDKKYKNNSQNQVIRSKVYVPKVEEKTEPKKETKLQKEINADGFLSGKADRPSPKKRG